MAQLRSFRLKYAALILLLVFTLTSGGLEKAGVELEQQSKRPILGSKPPKCDTKCYSCNPCVAVLVAPPSHKLATQGDESYYLLSWKCRCGNEYYHP